MAVKSGSRTRRAAGRGGAAVVLLATVVGCSEGGGGGGGGGTGDASAKPFEGETINFVVPFDPGGGYDTYTRTIAPYLGECLGAEMVVRNEPGAGSLLATNATAVAKPDGTRIQIMNMPGVVSSQLAGAEGVRFDVTEFSWIGRIAAPAEVVLAGKDSKLQTFDDFAQAKDPVKLVATGPGASDYIGAAVIAEAYGIPHEIATGFAGSQEATNAVIAGDADIHVMPFDSELATMKAGDTRPLALLAEELPEYMPESPLIGDVQPPPTEEGQELIDSFMTLSQTGRSIAAPPGLPEEQLNALRAGFSCAMENQELLDELNQQRRPLNVMEGAEYAELVKEALQPSEAFRTLLEKSF
ncbi:MAG: tripartite tricarboxylate transporter substrate-binding protein [Actinomycetota bacterium]|nr:tripartite tricarboxylate transporter substrate-binding protein [Actinomycetota bacterium]